MHCNKIALPFLLFALVCTAPALAARSPRSS